MTHHFLLRPIARPPADVEVLQYYEGRMVGVIPRPGAPRGGQVCLVGFTPSPWTPAHMWLLFNFIGWNRRNVAVAKPYFLAHGWEMWQTVIEDA
jgi:hypothetical protein